MADDDEWKKLSTEDKVQHKSWKARAEGYKECIKKFPMLDEKSPEFSKYLGLVKKFVIDSNELNRIQGLQAALLFVENASVAGKTCSEVISGVILKCFNTKPRLREVGINVCLMYVEIDKNELAQEEITKGFENKQPKVVHACVEAVATALRLFGSKVISVKPLIKQTIKLLDHRDKNVREAAKSLFVEIYRWIGPAIRAPLQNINSVVLKDLEDEWEKLGPGAQAKQTRFMRSQQDLREKMEAKAAAAEEGDGDGGSGEVVESSAVDPYELLEPVEILSKLPKTFYTQIEEKKWQERKMALEACEKLVTENPKLEAGDYGDLVKSLKRVLSKDTNILLVVIAIKCIGALASGLRKKFQPYALVCLDGMFERFKEKKPNVVTALQDAVDAIYTTTNLQAVSETVVEALAHKNPSIRAQVGLFLSRALVKTKPAAVNKALMKLFVQSLCKNIDHSTPAVRDAAFQATGTMLKLVGESKLHPFLADLDKLKMDKINECAGKADVKSSKSSTSTSTSASQPAKSASSSSSKEKTTKPVEKKQSKQSVQRPSKNVTKKPKSSSGSSAPPTEAEINDDVAEELVLKIISEEERKQILNSNWKERLAGLQATSQKLKMLERSEIPTQAIVKLLTAKPGWKDNNFNCMIERFKLLAFLAESSSFSRTSAGLCVLPAVDKVGDVKCGNGAKTALTSMSEATGMPWVAEQVLGHSMSQKNPKIQSESIGWLSQAIRDFGIAGLNVKFVIEKIKIAIAATNPATRTAAFSLIGTLTLFVGEKMRMFFESEKSSILQQIDAEMEKVKGQSPPAPCRGTKKQSSSAGADEEEEEEEEQGGGINFDDMVTRVDISSKITDDLVGKLNDKNWKIRKEGLDAVVEILNEAKFISGSVGDLPSALKARLSDSNKILVTLTLNILIQLSTSMGPHTAKHVSLLAPYIINTLGDSKPQIRQAALKCMNVWFENSKLSLWLEGDNMSTAISNSKQSYLRIELLNWLAEKLMDAKKLPASARESLELCVPVLYSCCEDRSGDVRAKAQAAIPAFMRHLSYEKLLRGTGKLSAGSKNMIVSLLDKAREQLPPPPTSKPAKSSSSAPPAPSKKQVKEEVSSEPSEKSSTKERKTSSKKEEAKKRAPSTQRKQKTSEEDASPTFINLPNGKEQRMKDEAKLKTIKWNFTTPRDELVTQLQQQLSTCAGPGLITELFHADFQHHIKAISMLQQALTSDWDNTLACLDVILRWFTLRFYDKNTTVHLKSLEYLKLLFDRLIGSDCRLSEYEAAAFLPHLITKIGENKDNIRKAIHCIMKQVAVVYPSSKLFNYIMDGIKSKNSRQRSECLDHIGLLIEEFGVNVCQPSAPKALKEIATNISDRDKGVRSSALNAIVAAYNVSGEIVYKQVGRLNEKDMSMLEERIKRSGKFTEGGPVRAPEQPPQSSLPASSASKSVKETKSMPSNLSKAPANIEKSHSAPERINNSHLPPVKSENEESLVPEEIKRGIAQLQEINVDHLLKPLPMPEFLRDREQSGMSSTAAAAIDVSIAQVASTNLDSSIAAIHELYEVLRHKDKLPHLKERMDQLLTSSTTLIRMTTDRYLPVVASDSNDGNVNPDNFRSLCKSHFAFLLELFNSHSLCDQFTCYTIYDFLRSVMPLMVNDQFVGLSYSSKLTKIMNLLVLRLLDHCDPTAVMCASIKLLTDSLESGSSSYYGIAIKCLWKLGRSLSELLDPKEVDGFRHQPLKVAALVAEIDRLWSTYPRGHEIYTRVGADMPLRSLKTVLLNLCKEPGLKMIDELHLINNPERSDVAAIVRKATGSSSKSPLLSIAHRKENIGSAPGMSLDMKLSGVFKKIGDRQMTKQGLIELYEFKRDHPHYDVDSHIEGLEVEFFREYVKRGLKKIEEERSSKGASQVRPMTSYTSSYQPDREHFARLNRLRANCGLEPLNKDEMSKRFGGVGTQNGSDPSSGAGSKILAPNTNSLNFSEPSSYRSKSASQVAPNPSSGPGAASSTSSSLLDIKRRLEQIKQSSARR